MNQPFGFGLFNIMQIIFIIVFVMIITMTIVTLIKNASNYKKNSSAPILTENAKVVTKRTEVRHRGSMQNNINSSRSHYYATFETEAGQRMELTLSGQEFGMLVEGDYGKLTYQGQWFKKFERGQFDQNKYENSNFEKKPEQKLYTEN